jgi:hypothetical protein
MKKMEKKILTLTITIMILTSMFAIFNFNNVSAATTDPAKLKIYIAPAKVVADNTGSNCVYVQLLDSSGKPARALHYVTISLSSSKTDIGTVDQSIVISPGETYGVAKFYSTTTPGTATISAATTGFLTVQAPITTTANATAPSKLALFCTPSLLPADGADYKLVLVQLQDSAGKPTKALENIYINMFISEPAVGSISPMLTIAQNETQVTGIVSIKNGPGSSTFTAQASNFATVQTKVTTYTIDFSTLRTTLSVVSDNILNGNKTDITAYVSADGNPVIGATVKFTSNNGGTFSTAKAQGGGYYKTTFTSPSFAKTTNCTITASASKTGYLNGQATTQISVGPTLTGNLTGTLQFCLKDVDGKALSNALVSSIVQPNGMTKQSEVTNSTGYVTFKNLAIGSYTFRIIKDGYAEMNQTINYKSQMPTLTITLTSNDVLDTKTLIIIISVVVVATVIAVISGLYIIKRKRSAKVRKLQDLQKHLKYKY